MNNFLERLGIAMAYILQTESLNVTLDRLFRHGDYVFCKKSFPSVSLLCRVLGNEERRDRAPDMLLVHDNVSERLVLVSDAFETAKEAFACVDVNTKQFWEIMSRDMSANMAAEPKLFLSEPKILCYDYYYNLFGCDVVRYAGKVIDGASVSIAFRPLKDGELVKFTSEPEVVVECESRLCDEPVKMEFWLSDMVDVQFDERDLVKLVLDEDIKQLFLQEFGWDDIQICIVGYGFTYLVSEGESDVLSVSESQWRDFVKQHLESFGRADNLHAQCCSYSWMDESVS